MTDEPANAQLWHACPPYGRGVTGSVTRNPKKRHVEADKHHVTQRQRHGPNAVTRASHRAAGAAARASHQSAQRHAEVPRRHTSVTPFAKASRRAAEARPGVTPIRAASHRSAQRHAEVPRRHTSVTPFREGVTPNRRRQGQASHQSAQRHAEVARRHTSVTPTASSSAQRHTQCSSVTRSADCGTAVSHVRVVSVTAGSGVVTPRAQASRPTSWRFARRCRRHNSARPVTQASQQRHRGVTPNLTRALAASPGRAGADTFAK
jgi:hypothetical protein